MKMVGYGWAVMAWHKAQLEVFGRVVNKNPPPSPESHILDTTSIFHRYLIEFMKATVALDGSCSTTWIERNRDKLSGMGREVVEESRRRSLTHGL